MKKSSLCLNLILFFLFCGGAVLSAQEFVSIYDDVSDGGYGRSVYRSVIRGVRIDRFDQFRTLNVESGLMDGMLKEGFLTPLVFSTVKKSRLDRGEFSSISRSGSVYRFQSKGMDISFSLEKPDSGILAEIDSYYADWPQWHEPVKNHYNENYVIRILAAENVFEPWLDLITYNEALISASLIADHDQWLWGVNDGVDILGNE